VVLLLLGATLLAKVPVLVASPLSGGALERALQEADRIFEEGAIRFEWSTAPGERESRAAATVVLSARPETKVVSGCSRELHDHRLGHTHLGARRVSLWTEQVARAVAGKWNGKDAPRVPEGALGTALGRVLAHELGHLFLRLNGHRDRGLMTPSFSHRALVGASDDSFRLSREDLERVRSVLAGLQVQSTDP
jgi:hypothetical protein